MIKIILLPVCIIIIPTTGGLCPVGDANLNISRQVFDEMGFPSVIITVKAIIF